MNKAREYSSPLMEELINETTSEELEKINKEMEKQLVTKDIFWLHKETEIRWKDIKHIEFQDDDIIRCYDDNDDSFYANVLRQQLETDEEFEERKRVLEKIRETSKERRHQQYLKLKEEFGNE